MLVGTCTFYRGHVPKRHPTADSGFDPVQDQLQKAIHSGNVLSFQPKLGAVNRKVSFVGAWYKDTPFSLTFVLWTTQQIQEAFLPLFRPFEALSEDRQQAVLSQTIAELEERIAFLNSPLLQLGQQAVQQTREGKTIPLSQ
jgi:hypothetical protein